MPPIYYQSGPGIPASALRLEDDFDEPATLFNRWKRAGVGSITPQSSLASNFGTLLFSAAGAADLVTLHRAMPLFIIPSGFWQFNVNCVIPVLSVAADRFIVRLGLGDVTVGDFQNGVYYEYSDNLNGGRWQACLANGGAQNKVDTLQAVSAGGVFSLKAKGIGPGLATYSINGKIAASNNIDFPTGNPLGLIMGLYNITATGAHTMLVDYFALYYDPLRA